jgi:hypothetical protein
MAMRAQELPQSLFAQARLPLVELPLQGIRAIVVLQHIDAVVDGIHRDDGARIEVVQQREFAGGRRGRRAGRQPAMAQAVGRAVEPVDRDAARAGLRAQPVQRRGKARTVHAGPVQIAQNIGTEHRHTPNKGNGAWCWRRRAMARPGFRLCDNSCRNCTARTANGRCRAHRRFPSSPDQRTHNRELYHVGTHRGAALLAICAARIAASPALAAEPAETGAQDSGALDTIVVVARKRQENVQSVPISIAALTGAALQQRGVARVGDLVGSVPNLTQDGGGSVLGAMGIRGIVSQTRNIGFDSGLGVYVDGVLTVRPNAADQELPDIATLEVLRGPQGTLFGRNTTAGAINITTRKPSLDGIEANARTAFGNLGTIEASLFATAPIVTDRLGVKIAGSIATRDGYITNLFDGSKLNNLNRKSLRGDLLWKPTETLEVALSGSWLKQADRLLLGQVADNTSGGLAGCRATSPIPTPSRRTIPACRAARSGAPTSTSTGTSAGSRSPRSAPMATTVRA